MHTSHRHVAPAGALALLALLAACSDSTGPASPASRTQAITLVQLDSTLTAGPARVEIEVLPGSLTVRELHLEGDDAEEKIVSPVTGLDTLRGTVTLALGGLEVSYGAGTRFRTPSQSHAGRAEWQAAVQAALAAGGTPTIEARRPAPAAPQAPTDSTFLAADLRLADRNDGPKLEVYVDGDNFVRVSAPPPAAILTVFGIALELSDSTEVDRPEDPGHDPQPGDSAEHTPDDSTHHTPEDSSATTPAPAGSIEFQAGVSAADTTARTITLVDGSIIQITDSTVFDANGDLLSLSATLRAVATGKAVRAEGQGTLVAAGPPRTIRAAKVKVEQR